jgi:glycosyltransferase involved in cell wall biosynthesis
MKVCLVGHYPAQDDNTGDLGTKYVGLQIARKISERHSTVEINIKEPRSWKRAKIFQPQLIHFILSPSMLGLVAAKFFALYCGDARTVLSAPNPNLPFWRLGALARPDLVLVQSHEAERMFTGMGCDTRFLPNGVDVERFLPAPPTTKVELREKYGLGGDRFVILHIGPIIRRRNIKFLAELQDADRQVIIIGRMPADRQVHQALLDAGCKVVTDYVEHIEEIYALSDCYVFPTPPANREASIEMPLSVLEAMSCNLPIITTRFGALPRVFEEGNGLVFVDSEDGIAQELYRVSEGVETRTRDKVLPYAWDNVINSLHGIYEEISHRMET